MHLLAVFAVSALLVRAEYFESLVLKPLPRNKALASFLFDSVLPAFPLVYANTSADEPHASSPRHYQTFPKSIVPIFAASNTRQLQLRFNQGWWDTESWGKLPHDGKHSGGTGMELAAVIEASSLDEARASWVRLALSLSGFFCALLNFVDDSLTTFPRHDISDIGDDYVTSANHSLFLMRAALPEEPVCTENLTPFLKLLPTRGKAGIASLLDGHKFYDSLWHSMSIEMATECVENQCRLHLYQNIDHIIDISRLLRRVRMDNFLKPTPSDELRCDLSKKYDDWTCFPLTDQIELEWDFQTIFGRSIKGACFQDDISASLLRFDVDRAAWSVELESSEGDQKHVSNVSDTEQLHGTADYNVRFRTSDSRRVLPVEKPPIEVSRSLTGYSQDKGGMRVNIRNPGPVTPVTVNYFETLPWFMRTYLYTLQTLGDGRIVSQFYKPAIDRKRPGHLELQIEIQPGSDFTFTFLFDKSLLLYAEYPPDANHGFAIAPAIVKVLDAAKQTTYQLRTTTLLLMLPTPDFSMPYNVIILTCTVMALAFGTIFNLLTKKVVTEEEFESAAKDTQFAQLKARVTSKLLALRR
ncbi:Gpi16 subunit, GPI transamidase component [Metschnikowia bicuspidata]|uniref:Gpi16 subunit, GPI transamidase component n=1 Tax=Metschnikowia bicuspidata TaxID=27322 RepID=A0A4P9ZAG6_9ASCO|nr:Gpi16 subunit, GPI transamidase component [Metschnikowia bicuspidata]